MILTRNTVPPKVFTGISEVIQEVGKESCFTASRQLGASAGERLSGHRPFPH